MIPPFQPDGNLPPGIHTATWEEVTQRFGGNAQRQRLLAGLRRAIANLQDAGCRRIYLNGSFVTAKPYPNDFDACWETDGVDWDAIAPVLYDAYGVQDDSQRQKAQYGGELYPVGERFGYGVFQFFQGDRQQRRKSIIAININSGASGYD